MNTILRHDAALTERWPDGYEKLAEVPGIAMPMHMALDSYAAVVKHGSTTVFSKAFHTGALAPYTFAGAAEAAERAGKIGIGPKLVLTDVTNQVLVFDFLGDDWRMAMVSDLQTGPFREAVVAAKRSWHKQPALQTTISPIAVAEFLAARLEPKLDQGTLVFKGGLSFATMQAVVEKIGQALAATGADLCPVHGENTASNVMINPNGSVRLLDFDRAVMADPWWDIGALSLELCRTEQERMELVEIYAGQSNSKLLARMKLYTLIDDFIWACWALLADDGPETSGPELYKYANNRLIRFGYHHEVFDIPSLLGEI
ncbi:phosphotransferase family protein [Pseudosulfitobacter pseudonitzschiae]|uniref:Phosphotransferase enzyme family protein n=3 Tax=Roseobacteraceae TaxID=2854170 RepID=A0A221K8G2_9RHOB|nr:phosphotransferase enzyme family protein [Pseudosulfitobacter pseudonitzschiae]